MFKEFELRFIRSGRDEGEFFKERCFIILACFSVISVVSLLFGKGRLRRVGAGSGG